MYYGDGVVFTTNRKKGLFSYSTPENGGLFSIYMADTIGGLGKRKSKFFSKDLNTKMNDGPVTFNSTRDTIYYTRNQLIDGKIDELSSQWNKLGIFSAILENGKWTNIQAFRFNSEWHNITTPCLSPDGMRLYFASDMPEGYGGSDLYYCNWENGYWDIPVNMGPIINTEGNEAYPYLNPSGEFFFSSDAHPGMGGKDIFLSRYVNSSWLKPVPLDPPINSEFEDFGFICDTLMNSGYFSSSREKSIDVFHFATDFPQLFYVNYQKESSFCYEFKDLDSILVDTTKLEILWNFGDGETATGTKVKHCYPGAGEYNLQLDVVDKMTDRIFLRKLEYSLKINEIEQAYINSPELIEKNKEIEFTSVGSNLPGHTVLSHTWDFGDNIHGYGDTISHSFAKEGDYEVTLFLTLRSNSTGKSEKTTITSKIKVVDNLIEKEYYLTEADNQSQKYINIEDCDITQLTTLYSAEKEVDKGAVFCIELLSSDEKLELKNPVFRRLPKKYILKERYNEEEQTYSYTVELQDKLMKLYPAYKEIRNLGFQNEQVKLIILNDPAEKELFSLHKDYEISANAYFDNYQRLTTDAYIMLDKIMKFLMKYPEKRLEVGVHTDNLGYASRNLSLSQKRAKILTDYIINRGIERNRVIAKGYGESKPIAPNSYEYDRKLNRRVEFNIR